VAEKTSTGFLNYLTYDKALYPLFCIRATYVVSSNNEHNLSRKHLFVCCTSRNP